ncbi:hypothetical protein FNW02_14670 [Komarekiella sp. 'clone 1']|uniref:Uncharacterized protein n=1 Tax=Komarekiella delphini-convector SJRDD-AB1 TaxID=2593771 RepID=A0AA40VRN8_9NOST|nr:hypothetical protein [Komarekiella delphini-convector]MBD6617042.1 hypothetical protein [Komarekiella delphini-convector SJRDD-AB1]
MTINLLMKLSMVTASATLGVAVLSNMGIASVSAAQFRVSGKFAPQAIVSEEGIASQLQNGFFDGTFEVGELDDERSMTNWNFNLRNYLGNIVYTLASNDESFYTNSLAASNDTFSNVLAFNFLYQKLETINNNYNIHLAVFNINFDTQNFVGETIPNFSFPSFSYNEAEIFLEQGKILYSFARREEINIASGRSEMVPEPLTVASTVVAGIMGWWIKRQKASQEL